MPVPCGLAVGVGVGVCGCGCGCRLVQNYFVTQVRAQGRICITPNPLSRTAPCHLLQRGGGCSWHLIFAFQIDREISHVKFRVLREFLAHQRYTLWTLAGGTT